MKSKCRSWTGRLTQKIRNVKCSFFQNFLNKGDYFKLSVTAVVVAQMLLLILVTLMTTCDM